jgi:rod shape-determining protein MreD
VLNLIEIRFPWRNFWQNWLAACLLIAGYLVIAALVSGVKLTVVQLGVLVPQVLLSILVFPIVASLAALLDRMRLLRIKHVG